MKTRKVDMSDGDIIEVALIVPGNYRYDDVDRNDFIQGFDTGTATDREVERALDKGWARKIRKVGEWK